MKEIGKLIELLNEYEKKGRKSEYYEWEKGIGGPNNLFRRDTRDDEGSHIYSTTADTYIISKKYGFIKWLVENDKIDTEKVGEIGFIGKYDFETNYYLVDEDNMYDKCETLLMLLSISDTPIEDLLLYLK